MWLRNNNYWNFSMDQIFHDLIHECKYVAPGAQLTYTLRNRLEKYKKEVRKDIVSNVTQTSNKEEDTKYRTTGLFTVSLRYGVPQYREIWKL
ncbi:hypothetical protein ALC62_00176 [Cyphomyrmex costatus]|uniref:Uncharacterized protein n=1 Tax=Cyphomyrmex costatus TaxID=456900 RepID=A0A151K2U1_9HYME|nr:hypothetical protein ALC62_00176 [Cyphomyrmex costatus]